MSRVNVNFKGKQKRVSDEDGSRQSCTMRLILDKLREQPGVILCDEVGMGKTYVALGVIAQYLASYPRSRVLVLTPSSDLAEKWTQDLERFRNENVSRSVGDAMQPQHPPPRRLEELLGAKNKRRVWVLPLSVFFHSHQQSGQVAFRDIVYQLISRGANLALADRKVLWKRLDGRSGKAPRLRQCVDWNGWRIPSMRNAVRSILNDRGCLPFDPERISSLALKKLQDDIRWRLIKMRMRKFSLIVVDEAHHFKNPDTKRYRALEGVFEKSFRDMLFLTATPFQLGPDELENIMLLFRLSTERASSSIPKEAELLTSCARDYQGSVNRFEYAWRKLSDNEKQSVCDKSPLMSLGFMSFTEAYKDLQHKHNSLEQILSKWVIRNVKPRPYRKPHDDAVTLDPIDQMPFAFLHRLLYEYQRHKRTFSATQNISLSSSWEAFQASVVMNGKMPGSRPVSFYRRAMRLLVEGDDISHPKFKNLLEIARGAFAANEKVLVFTSRIETVRALQTKLNSVLEADIYDHICHRSLKVYHFRSNQSVPP